MNHNIYLGLTTTRYSNLREKIEEIKKFSIKEIALFPTALNPDQRKELYQELEKTPVKYIPFVHLRHDSNDEEIEYFINKYQTKRFNIHSTPDALESFATSKYKDLIYIENTDHLRPEFFSSLQEYAGLCFDVAHWEDYGIKQKDDTYVKFEDVVKQTKIGFSHLSSVMEVGYPRHYEYFSYHDFHYSAHLMEKIEDMSYLKKYIEYLPEILGIELENTLAEQIEVKQYIEKEVLGI